MGGRRLTLVWLAAGTAVSRPEMTTLVARFLASDAARIWRCTQAFSFYSPWSFIACPSRSDRTHADGSRPASSLRDLPADRSEEEKIILFMRASISLVSLRRDRRHGKRRAAKSKDCKRGVDAILIARPRLESCGDGFHPTHNSR